MILGFTTILLMGVTLGLLGAGGSIMTVPILVYLLKINPTLATSYSLLLVGFTALIGAFFYQQKKQIDYAIAIKFAFPSLISVYLTRRFILPIIPENITFYDLVISKDLLILLLFSAMMFAVSVSMIKKSNIVSQLKPKNISPISKNLFIIIEAIAIGAFTGIIGAGGGFLIVPTLVLLNKIDIKTAIGSSLLIIAIKSLIGFIGDLQAGVLIDFSLAINLIILSSIGMIIGAFLGKYVNASHLKRGFGLFVMLISIVIITKEIIL